MFGLVLRLFSTSPRRLLSRHSADGRFSFVTGGERVPPAVEKLDKTHNKVKERFDSVDILTLSSPTQLDWYELICDLKLLYFCLSCVFFYLIG